MKRIILIAALLLFAVPAMAATVTLAWDPMPAGQSWTGVTAYEQIGTVYTQVAKVTGTPPASTLSFQATTGTHTYVVRSTNGQSESPNSNSVQGIILSTPTTPTTITITITVP